MADSPESGGFKLASSTSHLLHRAQQMAADRFAFLVGPDGPTLRQFAVLAAIAEAPGLSQTDLVRATGIDRSTLADMMNRMSKHGWVHRSSSETDGRVNLVRLAPPGAHVLMAARPHARAADAAVLDALPKPKRKAFQATLERLSHEADEQIRRAEKARLKAERKKQKKKKPEAKSEAKLEAKSVGEGGAKKPKSAKPKSAEPRKPRATKV